jgi:hypothetical protein
MLGVERQNTEQIDETEESGKETRVPVGHEGDAGDQKECADEVSADSAAASPGRNGRESTGVRAVNKILDAEDGERNGKEIAAELREAVHG